MKPRLFAFACLVLLTSCASGPRKNEPSAYPAHWFAAVNDPSPPAWEILPDAAGPGEVILSKRHELGVLSNFAPTPFEFHGLRYASLEGFWQMMLYPEASVNGKRDPRARARGVKWKYTRAQVAGMSAFEAKAAGDLAFENMRKLGIDWVSFEGKRMAYWTSEKGDHYRVIYEAMGEKLRQNPRVREVLLATGDLKLRPDHHQEPGAPPAWRYFDIWMEYRAEAAASALP